MSRPVDSVDTLLTFDGGSDALSWTGSRVDDWHAPFSSRWELHQIGGLTAGTSFPIRDGRLRMGADRATVGFEIVSDGTGSLVVHPGAAPVQIDGQLVTTPTVVVDELIVAGTAAFVVRRTPESAPLRRSRPGLDDNPCISVDAHDDLLEHLRSTRRAIETGKRRTHPDPAELVRAAERGGPIRWSRRYDDPQFGQLSIALAELAWKPRFDHPGKISAATATAINPLRVLRHVPVVADLGAGPLVVIGSRAARLAVARFVTTSLATLTPADDLELAIVAPWDHAADWAWADRLPHATGGVRQARPVLIVDGAEQIDDGIADALAGPKGIGGIILTDDATKVPTPCSMTMFVNDDFSATIVDHRSQTTRTRALPLGITESVARAVAEQLRLASDRRSVLSLSAS